MITTTQIKRTQFTGMHDTAICKCPICIWAAGTSERRAYADWDLEAKMNDFLRDYGSEALMEKINEFVTARGLW